MTPKASAVNMLLDREIQDSRLMHYLSEERDKKLSENKATRDSIEREHKKEVEVYTQACWIKVKGKELFLPITEEMPDGLTPQQKADLLKTHSTKKNKAQVISIGDMEHILFETKIEIPSNLLNKDPRENEEFQDWIMSMLKKNLPCKVFLGLELM